MKGRNGLKKSYHPRVTGATKLKFLKDFLKKGPPVLYIVRTYSPLGVYHREGSFIRSSRAEHAGVANILSVLKDDKSTHDLGFPTGELAMGSSFSKRGPPIRNCYDVISTRAGGVSP